MRKALSSREIIQYTKLCLFNSYFKSVLQSRSRDMENYKLPWSKSKLSEPVPVTNPLCLMAKKADRATPQGRRDP